MANTHSTKTGIVVTGSAIALIVGLFVFQVQSSLEDRFISLLLRGQGIEFSGGFADSSQISSSIPASSVASSVASSSAGSSTAATSSSGPECGNNILEQGEKCEPPGFGTCNLQCQHATTAGGGKSGLASSSKSSAKRLAPPKNCGNGVVEPEKGEACDNGRMNGLGPDCSLYCEDKFCGDGIVSPENGEECDEPGGESVSCGKTCAPQECDETGCAKGCRWLFLPKCVETSASSEEGGEELPEEASSSSEDLWWLSSSSMSTDAAESSSSSVQPASADMSASSAQEAASSEDAAVAPETECGNGLPEAGEECDDGNANDGDGCSLFCTIEAGQNVRCGDGELAPWEQCDDGDRNSDTTPDACRTMCRLAYCGDKVLDAGEQCDDGNDILGDGCTPTCVKSLCGNGVLELGEECDEGKRNSDSTPDSCSTLCLMPRCGDAIVDPSFGEACDQGTSNAATPDQCRPWCALPLCGDGILDTGEECDDGNSVAEDGCDVSCHAGPLVEASNQQPADTHAAAPVAEEGLPLWWWLLLSMAPVLGGVFAANRYIQKRRS